jgi:hypothetical protein
MHVKQFNNAAVVLSETNASADTAGGLPNAPVHMQ